MDRPCSACQLVKMMKMGFSRRAGDSWIALLFLFLRSFFFVLKSFWEGAGVLFVAASWVWTLTEWCLSGASGHAATRNASVQQWGQRHSGRADRALVLAPGWPDPGWGFHYWTFASDFLTRMTGALPGSDSCQAGVGTLVSCEDK